MKVFYSCIVIITVVFSSWFNVASAQSVVTDANLLAVVRTRLSKPTGDITAADMATLTDLFARYQNISDLTGLEHATNLRSVSLDYNQISDISALSGLTSLTRLTISNNRISDISALSGLTSLTTLYFRNNQISDISALSGLTSLTTLYLGGNQISDISTLSRLTSLTHLGLGGNQISDISTLSGLTSLTNLYLGNNRISNISALSGLTSLTDLYLDRNQISDISVLSRLTSLSQLYLGDNRLSDISALSGLTSLWSLQIHQNQLSDIRALTRLTSLVWLYLDNNRISDISTLSELQRLTSLRLDYNRISDISALSKLTSLTTLSLSGNQIRDISALSGLTRLTWLQLSINQIRDISPLSGLTSLTWLGLYNNQISDISPLSGLTSLTGEQLDISALPASTSLPELPPESPPTELPPESPPTELPPESNPLQVEGNPLQASAVEQRVRNPSPVAQDRVLFNELHNAHDDNLDWLELKNISEEPVTLTDWEISLVTGQSDVDVVHFPEYELPAGGILLITNTDPSQTGLAKGQNIASSNSKAGGASSQYVVSPKLKLPNSPYLLLLRSATDKNGKPEAFEDVAGNYFRNTLEYETQVWPLQETERPRAPASLTRGEAWQRVDVEHRGYLAEAWGASGYQSGLGYKPKAPARFALGTPGYPNGAIVQQGVDGQISVSEVMFTSKGGLHSLPQWIELYNNSDTEVVNLAGWQLEVESRDAATDVHRHGAFNFEALDVLPNQTVLLVTWNGRNSVHLPEHRVYRLHTRHEAALQLGAHRNGLLSAAGFSLSLSDTEGTLIDVVGNLDGDSSTRDAPVWALPAGETSDGHRTSLRRKYEAGTRTPLDGKMAASWVRSAEAKALSVTTHWGHPSDIGNPGYRSGGPLPVALSGFRAARTESGVVIKWTTESALNNAGFNILRSETKAGPFFAINPVLIGGAGTSGERHHYTWKDTSATPAVTYYYQLEEVSYAGERQRLRITRLKGELSAKGKAFLPWGALKQQQE